MKKVLIKIPAMIAMLITLFSFFFYVQAFFDTESDIWILSVIVAILSVFFYFIDAIISFVRAIKKKDRIFNFILTAVLILAIPMVVIFAGSGRASFRIIWNVYYLLMLVLEIISIKRCINL